MRVDEFLARVDSALIAGGEKARLMGLTRVWGGIGLILDDQTQDLLIRGRDLNLGTDWRTATTLYSGIALSKMAEAARWLDDGGNTPLVKPETHHGATGYKGGGRRGELIFGVSGAEAEDDFAVGAEMVAGFWRTNVVLVHHIGIRHATKADYLEAVRKLEAAGLKGIVSPAPDHQRTYFEIGPSTYLELQYFEPDLSMQDGSHVDLVVQRPLVLLRTLGETKVFDRGTEPQGMVQITKTFTVMARSQTGGLWVPKSD